jgi:hypothetical protein
MEELKKILGAEFKDPRSLPFNVDVAYGVGGGTYFYCNLALGDGVVDHESYVRQRHTSSTSSSSQSHQSQNPKTGERLRCQDELINNLMQSEWYIILMVGISN